MPLPNFKSFSKALNKKILFLFPLAGMKNTLKKMFPLDGKTVFTGRNICQIEKAEARKAVATKSKEVFLKKIVLHVLIWSLLAKSS